MANHCIKAAAALMAVSALAGCIDNKYDLSDIDKTVGVSVNDLVIPINIDEIKLESIISTSGKVVELDGEYAYVTDGTYSSDPVKVEAVWVDAFSIDPSVNTLKKLVEVPAGMEAGFSASSAVTSTYNFEATSVSSDIHSITRAMCSQAKPATLIASLDLTDLKGYTSKVLLQEIKLQLPTGTIFESSTPSGSYDAATSYFTLDDIYVDTDKGLTLTIKAKGFDIDPNAFDYATHTLRLTGELGLGEGKFLVSGSDMKGGEVPSNPALRINYTFNDFEISAFDGSLQYTVEDLDVPSIDINDLPSLLEQPGTDLKLKNPRIYLSVNNPIASLGLYAETGLTLIANREKSSKSFSIDNGTFTIGKDKAVISNFCISPEFVANSEYPNAQHVAFTSLSNVLSGDGLPTSIDVDLDGAQIPLQECKNFALGQDYGKVDGTYKFIAPFALKKGSIIEYRDATDGWSDETLDKLVISKLVVNMNVTTDVPVGVKLEGYPVDQSGNQIGNVKIDCTEIQANAANQPVALSITGEIKHLDGIIFRATATAQSENALKPDMTIKLTNVRPCVTGTYIDEL